MTNLRDTIKLEQEIRRLKEFIENDILYEMQDTLIIKKWTKTYEEILGDNK